MCLLTNARKATTSADIIDGKSFGVSST